MKTTKKKISCRYFFEVGPTFVRKKIFKHIHIDVNTINSQWTKFCMVCKYFNEYFWSSFVMNFKKLKDTKTLKTMHQKILCRYFFEVGATFFRKKILKSTHMNLNVINSQRTKFCMVCKYFNDRFWSSFVMMVRNEWSTRKYKRPIKNIMPLFFWSWTNFFSQKNIETHSYWRQYH